MKPEALFEMTIWQNFLKEARKRRLNPLTLVADLLREQVEIWEDEKLFREMQRDARKSQYTEKDTVALVRPSRRAHAFNRDLDVVDTSVLISISDSD